MTPGAIGLLTRLTALYLHFEVPTGFFQEVFSLPDLEMLNLSLGFDVPAGIFIATTSLTELALVGHSVLVRSYR